MSEALIEIQTHEFNEKTAQGVVFLDFYADWCGPCRMMAPVIEKLAVEFKGQIQFYKFDVDSDREIPTRFKIFSIPTFVILKDGQEVERVVGIKDEEGMKACLTPHL
ncbi:MAG: thioredoxin [Chlamydiia bacterium]|nr:thioredoxin [Chlamydiia bacterium]